MENTYAHALWKMLERGMKPKEAVEMLSKILSRLGRESLLPKIGRAFARIAAREQARTGVVLSVARQKDLPSAQREARALFTEMRVDPGEVVAQIEESLIGGWRAEGRGTLVDASFKKHLVSLYNRATQ